MSNKVKQIQQTIFDIKDSFIPNDKRVYYPSWDNAPPHQISVVKWNETHLLSKGGILCLCAKSGVGKSSLMEAFVSNHLNDNADSLGIKIDLSAERNKILICDTERSQWESHKAWLKLMKRANIVQGEGLQNQGLNQPENKVIFANLKALGVLEKKDFVNKILVENTDIGMIVFDGSSDFVINTNDNVESSRFIDWINTFNPNIALMFTIHTNPNDDKPRGHLGGELWRKSESVLLATRQDQLFTLTTDFSSGKNRHAEHITWNYRYCDDEDMFVSTDESPKSTKKSEEKYGQMALDIWDNKPTMYFTDIVEAIAKKTKKSYGASKQIFNRNFKNILCEQVGKDGWKIIGTN